MEGGHALLVLWGQQDSCIKASTKGYRERHQIASLMGICTKTNWVLINQNFQHKPSSVGKYCKIISHEKSQIKWRNQHTVISIHADQTWQNWTRFHDANMRCTGVSLIGWLNCVWNKIITVKDWKFLPQIKSLIFNCHCYRRRKERRKLTCSQRAWPCVKSKGLYKRSPLL